MHRDEIAAALKRAEDVFQRRPGAGLKHDATATAHWEGGLKVATSHANGTRVESDMPPELGGEGAHTTPGWLFRAGLAACTVTSIAMVAASRGIALTALDVEARSRSDVRGVLRMSESDGALVHAGPCDLVMAVRIAASDVSGDVLRALVEDACRSSPIANAVRYALPIDLRIDADDA